jgi:hypothetical protein
MSAHPAPRATRAIRAETAGSSGLALGPNQRGKGGGGGEVEASTPVMAMAHQRTRRRVRLANPSSSTRVDRATHVPFRVSLEDQPHMSAVPRRPTLSKRSAARASSRLSDLRPERDEQFDPLSTCVRPGMTPLLSIPSQTVRWSSPLRAARVLSTRTTADGAFMEQSGRNRWQLVANGTALKAAETSQNRCHGLRPVAKGSAW